MASQMPASEKQYQLDHIHESRQEGLLAFYIVMLMATMAIVVGRFASRKFTGPGLGMDDWAAGVALLLLLGTFAVNFLYITAGLGHHSLANTPAQQKLALRIGFPANILYTITWPAIKISILLLYRRIFFVNRRFTQFIDVFLGVLACYIISTVLVDVFGCSPISKSWEPLEDGHCIDSKRLFKVTAGLNVAFDIIILVAPLPLVWGLQASLKLKTAVSCIFAIGGLTCITSIMRIVSFDQINHFDNTWSYVDADYWTAAELTLSLICACLPTIHPLWLSALNNYRNFVRSLSRSSRSNNSSNVQNYSDQPPNGQAPGVVMRSRTDEERKRFSNLSPSREGFRRLEGKESHLEWESKVGGHTRRQDLEWASERRKTLERVEQV